MLAAILTSVMVVSLTVYAWTTELDYTKLLPYMFMASIVLITASVCAAFVRVPLLHLVISAITVVFFGVYLIVDTQLILDGTYHSLELDDYVLGAVFLYIDIITIFVEILKVAGSRH